MTTAVTDTETTNLSGTIDNQSPEASDNEDLANTSGTVTQEVINEDDGDGVDTDPEGALNTASIDLDPSTTDVNDKEYDVFGEGTWSEDSAGNVTFIPESTFYDDPTPITYTIEDDEEAESNEATIVVDYVPVAEDDLYETYTAGIVTDPIDILSNDIEGDTVVATTVTLETTNLPTGSACTVTDEDEDCVEMTVPDQGVWTIDETTGEAEFAPLADFEDTPDTITYSVEDDQGNSASATITVTEGAANETEEPNGENRCTLCLRPKRLPPC